MQRLWITLAALEGCATVALSAFAAHGLHALDPARIAMVDSSIQIQFWHALALFGTGLWAERGGLWADLAGVSFLAGTIAFAAGVWSIALQGPPIGFIAPWGGSLLMIAWLLLAVSALRAR